MKYEYIRVCYSEHILMYVVVSFVFIPSGDNLRVKGHCVSGVSFIVRSCARVDHRQKAMY